MKTLYNSIAVVFGLLVGNCAYAQSPANNAYGDNQAVVDYIGGNPVFAIYSGDVNQDQNIDINDQPQLESDISNFAFGYLPTDINGDGNVDINDQPIVELNISNFVYSAQP